MTPTHAPRTHVGHDYLVAALAEFYTASGFGATATHRQRPVDRDVPMEGPRSSEGVSDPLRGAAETADSPRSVQGTVDTAPVFMVDRFDDGPRLAPGQSNDVTLSVYGTTPVHIRDRLPVGWSIEDGDAHSTYTADDVRYVEFGAPISAGTRTYRATPPDDVTHVDPPFGPLEFSPDDGDTWLPMDATTRTNTVPELDSCTC